MGDVVGMPPLCFADRAALVLCLSAMHDQAATAICDLAAAEQAGAHDPTGHSRVDWQEAMRGLSERIDQLRRAARVAP